MLSSRENALLILESLLGAPALAAESGGAVEDRLSRELAFGTVRHLSRIDWIIARFGERPVSRISPRALAALRLGVYQLLFLESVPPYAAVSESVNLAGKFAPRAAGFVNWLLRRIGPEARALPARADIPGEANWLATFHSFPPWLVRRWVARFGAAEAEALMAALNRHPPPHVRVNTCQATVEEVSGRLAAEGAVERGRYSPMALHLRLERPVSTTEEFLLGRIYLQDESSQLAALVLAPRPGERILDACAGVGGKATQMAEIARDAAQIVATDSQPSRLARLEENTRRLRLGTVLPRRGNLLAPGFLDGERFDRVLVDAPCSGLGTLARHPELKWSKRPSDPNRLAGTQLRLLRRAAGLLVPGGVIAYSTCTTEPEENEEVVRRFLGEHTAFAVETPPQGVINHVEELLTPEGFLQSLPHRHGIGGAFLALLRRT